MINKVILVGNLGKDPEIRYAQSGDKVANFSVATDRRWRDRDGNRQTKTEWHRVCAWRGLADIVDTYVQSGSLVYVEGRVETRKQATPSGDRWWTQVVADTVRVLSGGRRTEDPEARDPGGWRAKDEGAPDEW